jgi:predicted ester cyclase
MTTPTLVADFYHRIWNCGDKDALPDILTTDFSFRGSLGTEVNGYDLFWEYVCSVRSALSDYRCDILDCVSEGDQSFARMKFSGVHVGDLRGYRPTGLAVHWNGAALFRFANTRIQSLWVLGDLVGLDALLKANESARHNHSHKGPHKGGYPDPTIRQVTSCEVTG